GGNAISGDLSITNGAKVTFGRSHQIIDTGSVTMSGNGSVFNGIGINSGQFDVTETFANLTVTSGAFNTSANGNWTITGLASFTGSADPLGTIVVGNSGTTVSFDGLSLKDMTATAGGNVSAPNAFTLYGNSGARVSSMMVGAGGITLDNSVLNQRQGNKGSQLILSGGITTVGTLPSSIKRDSSGGTTGVINLRLDGANLAVNTGTGADLTIDVSVIDHTGTPGGIEKTGAGKLIYSGIFENTYSGTTTVSEGILQLSQTSGVNAITGDLAIAGGFVTYTANDQIADTANVTMSSGALNGLGSNNNPRSGMSETIGSLTVTGGAFNTGNGSQWTVIGAGSFTGSAIPGGTVFVGNSGATGAVTTFGSLSLTNMNGTGSITAANTFGIGGNQLVTVVVGSGGLTLDNSAIRMTRGTLGNGARLILEGDVSAVGTAASTISGFVGDGGNGTLSLELGNTGSGAVTRTIDVAAGGASLSIQNAITDGGATSGAIIKTGAGQLSYSGLFANTYTGDTSINGGTLRLEQNSGVDAVAGNLFVNSGGTLTMGASHQLADTAGITANGGTISSWSTDETFAF
ncbi:MAG: autotransporter-associated beta strand repeat-containing protein, partial [Verrucomicrobiae bacterium]|nr:autotransporter-associated beta strand repeat-containing protein [Verrucomicrobiae bacterium]